MSNEDIAKNKPTRGNLRPAAQEFIQALARHAAQKDHDDESVAKADQNLRSPESP